MGSEGMTQPTEPGSLMYRYSQMTSQFGEPIPCVKSEFPHSLPSSLITSNMATLTVGETFGNTHKQLEDNVTSMRERTTKLGSSKFCLQSFVSGPISPVCPVTVCTSKLPVKMVSSFLEDMEGPQRQNIFYLYSTGKLQDKTGENIDRSVTTAVSQAMVKKESSKDKNVSKTCTVIENKTSTSAPPTVNRNELKLLVKVDDGITLNTDTGNYVDVQDRDGKDAAEKYSQETNSGKEDLNCVEIVQDSSADKPTGSEETKGSSVSEISVSGYTVTPVDDLDSILEGFCVIENVETMSKEGFMLLGENNNDAMV